MCPLNSLIRLAFLGARICDYLRTLRMQSDLHVAVGADIESHLEGENPSKAYLAPTMSAPALICCDIF